MGIGPAALKRTGGVEGPAPRAHTAVRVPWGYSKLLSYTHITSEALESLSVWVRGFGQGWRQGVGRDSGSWYQQTPLPVGQKLAKFVGGGECLGDPWCLQW